MRVFQPITASTALLVALVAADDSAPTVSVKNGSYYGLHQDTYDQDLFLGMPFAQPPVGSLRFANPQSLNETWSDAKNATEYSPECYGYGSDQWVLGNILSEDCLTLNVVRPSGISESADLPVAVWIHGGGYFEGGSRDARYNLTYIVDQGVKSHKPFIGVSFNYRLSGFGFLWGSDVEDAGLGNVGLKDQRLALNWVKENIGYFGGNPDQVTIWGESAGAFSVGNLLIAHGGRDDGLFRGAIMESGSASNAPWANIYLNATSWDSFYKNITDAVDCSSTADTLTCLRQVPIQTLSNAFNVSSATSGRGFRPVIDGEFIVDNGFKLLTNGKFVHVPILLGQNHDEGSVFASKGINTDEEFLTYLVQVSKKTEEQAAILAKLYPDIPEIGIPGTLEGRPSNDSGYGLQFKRVAAYAGDMAFHAARRFMSQVWAENGLVSYNYVFNVLVNGLSQYIGATHFQEVAFVFNNVNGDGYGNAVSENPFENEPESFVRLANLMSRMWVSFIVDQTPNDSGVTALDWPAYTLDDPQVIVFDVNVTELAYVEADTYRAEGIAYIQEIYKSS
jgi:carboxylesterase type B